MPTSRVAGGREAGHEMRHGQAAVNWADMMNGDESMRAGQVLSSLFYSSQDTVSNNAVTQSETEKMDCIKDGQILLLNHE